MKIQYVVKWLQLDPFETVNLAKFDSYSEAEQFVFTIEPSELSNKTLQIDKVYEIPKLEVSGAV